jgi:AcrR family transcriptional regulator
MARRADHTHQQIRQMAIDAARQMIRQDGLEKLKLRAIAREIGYAPGTLYNVFDSFDELMMQVNADTVEALVAELAAVEPANGVARLTDLLGVYGTFAQQNSNLWKAVFDYVPNDPNNTPDWYVAKINDGLLIVERAIADIAGPSPAHSPSDVARLLWAGLHGIFSLGAEGNLKMVSQTDAGGLAHLFIQLIEGGLRK